jgi:hypothetical protein
MDVKRIVSELRRERQQIEMEILSVESSGWLADRTMTSGNPECCAHKQKSEEEQDHDFCGLLAEFENAVRQEDGIMANYCASGLKRMFRERTATATSLPQSNVLAKDGN